MNLKNIQKVFTSKFVGTGPSFYKKRIYRNAVSQSLRNTALYAQGFMTSIVSNVAGRDSSVGIATRYGLDDPGIEFQ